jgi:hypothetical protein
VPTHEKATTIRMCRIRNFARRIHDQRRTAVIA